MSLLPYTLLVAATLLGLSAVFAGVGLLVRRLLGFGVRDARGLWVAAWLGWAGAIGLLQVWHLAFPVDGRAFGLVGAVAAAGLLLGRVDLAALWRRDRRQAAWFAVLLAAAALWLANQSINQPRHPDSGLYHLASVKWACSYPIVPGLGNLRNILGYNHSYFLYAAMLNVGPFADRYHHLASAWPIFLILAGSLAALWKLLIQRAEPSAWLTFDGLLCAPAAVYAMSSYGSSPSPDVGVWVLTLAVGSEVLRLLEDAASADRAVPPAELRLNALAVMLLAAAGVTVKLSLAAAGLSAALLAGGLLWRRRSAAGLTGARMLAAALGAACLLVPWVARGVITSGYPAYPSTFGGFPVAWRVPAEVARANAEWLRAWGRMPDRVSDPAQALGHGRWVWLWLNGVLREPFWVVTPLLLALGVAPLLCACRRAACAGARPARLPWLFLAVPLASLAFWFGTSPQVRFASASFLALGLGALALALRGTSRQTAAAVVLSVTAVLFAHNVDVFEFVRPWHKNSGLLRKGQTIALQTDSGLTVHVPAVEGEFCWDAPLPSTSGRSFLQPGLRLRRPGDLGGGFVIDRTAPQN